MGRPPDRLDEFLASERSRLLAVIQAVVRRWNLPISPEDVLQEAVLRALGSRERVRGFSDARLRSWMLTIARNYAISVARKRDDLAPVDPVSLADVGDPDPETFAGDEQALALDALWDLPPAYRTVLLLREYLNLPWATVAKIIGKSSPDAARQQYAAALRSVRHAVDRGRARPRDSADGPAEPDFGE